MENVLLISGHKNIIKYEWSNGNLLRPRKVVFLIVVLIDFALLTVSTSVTFESLALGCCNNILNLTTPTQ